jgi:hypothetical protein
MTFQKALSRQHPQKSPYRQYTERGELTERREGQRVKQSAPTVNDESTFCLHCWRDVRVRAARPKRTHHRLPPEALARLIGSSFRSGTRPCCQERPCQTLAAT